MGFFKAIFDDRDKSVNAAHVVAYVLVAASIVWVSYLVFKTLKMPDLSGVAYLLGGSGAMNVANKMEDIVSKFTKKPVPIPDTVVPDPGTVIVKKKIDTP